MFSDAFVPQVTTPMTVSTIAAAIDNWDDDEGYYRTSMPHGVSPR